MINKVQNSRNCNAEDFIPPYLSRGAQCAGDIWVTCLENQEFHHAVAGHSLLPHTLYPSSVLSKHFGNALQSYEFVISNTETLLSEQCEHC